MKRQAMVIGLGQFGMAVARELTARHVEILAIDVDEEKVRLASGFATDAVRLDAMDAEALGRTSPDRRDVCICAIGDESKEASIICTALLRQMGARRLIARANDELHARILSLVGAHQVINPEREFGARFANQILHEGIKGELALGEGILLSEVEVPGAFVGHTLGALQLPRRHGVTVVAIRKHDPSRIELPDSETLLGRGDVLVLVAKEGQVTRMLERS